VTIYNKVTMNNTFDTVLIFLMLVIKNRAAHIMLMLVHSSFISNT